LARVHDSDADAAVATFARAEVALQQGEPARAATLLRALTPRLADAAEFRRCAELMLAARCDADATLLAERIAREHPDAWDWCWQFAGHMRAKGDLDASRSVLGALRDASVTPAQRLRAELGLALGLPSVYDSATQLHAVRAQFALQLVDFIAKYTPDQVRRSGATAQDVSWDNFLLAYHGENDVVLQTQFGDWLSASLQALLPHCAAPVAAPARSRPRLAFVSSSFHRCTVGFYFAAWIEHLAQCEWELVLVNVGTRRDQLTERLGRAAHAQLTLAGDIAENARVLRELAADIIVYPDLGMDRHVLALAALRLAPRQACAWGHPVTTGLSSIDMFISCAQMEPPDAQQHYRERLLLLPGLGTRYLSPRPPETPARSELGLPAQRPLYLVPQALFKLHPDHDEVLVEIVRRDPDALFVLFELHAPSGVRRVRERLLRALANVSAQPQHHLHWFAECPRLDYLRINRACDVMVDSLHWSGGNATLDALHCGLPVVTCPGRYMRGRQSAAMLRMLDCAQLITASPQQLAETAVAIAHDPARRAALAARIAANLPHLTQSSAPLQELDRGLRAWCNETAAARAN
jgi:CRISPR-associated protein Csy1